MSLDFVGVGARGLLLLAVVYAALLIGDYLMRNRPGAAGARLAAENAAAVNTARAVYVQRGCLSIDAGETMYLDHRHCGCASSSAMDTDALAAGDS